MKKAAFLAALLLLAGCATNPVIFRGKGSEAGLYVGMTKEELVARLGYPPEGRAEPYLFTQSSITKHFEANGISETWDYESFTYELFVSIENGRVRRWTEYR